MAAFSCALTSALSCLIVSPEANEIIPYCRGDYSTSLKKCQMHQKRVKR